MKRLKYILLTTIILVGTIFIMPSIVKGNYFEDATQTGDFTKALTTNNPEFANESQHRDEYFEARPEILFNKCVRYGNYWGEDRGEKGGYFDAHEICIDNREGVLSGENFYIKQIIDAYIGIDECEITTYNGSVPPVTNKKKNGEWDNPAGKDELDYFVNVAWAAHLAGDAVGSGSKEEKVGIYYGAFVLCNTYWLQGKTVMGVDGYYPTGEYDLNEHMWKFSDYVNRHSDDMRIKEEDKDKVLHVRMLLLNGNFDKKGYLQNQLIYASRFEDSKTEKMKIIVEKHLSTNPYDKQFETPSQVSFGLYEQDFSGITTEELKERGYTEIKRRDNYYLYNKDGRTEYVKKIYENKDYLYKMYGDDGMFVWTDDGGRAEFNISYDPDVEKHYIVEEVGGDGTAGSEWAVSTMYINWGKETDENGNESEKEIVDNHENIVENVTIDSWERNGDIVTPPITYNNYEAQNYYVCVTNTKIISKNKAIAKIIKKDGNTSKYLEGAKFKLVAYDANGKILHETEEKTTDEKGEAEFEISEPGTYTIWETQAPKGYKIDNEKNGTQTITVDKDDINSGTVLDPEIVYNYKR